MLPEEADARIIVHLRDAVNHGFSNIIVRTVDSDVIAIIIGHTDSLIAMDPNVKVVVAFNVGSKYNVLNVTSMALALPEKVRISFPVIHAFTGCDTVSFFSGHTCIHWMRHSIFLFRS